MLFKQVRSTDGTGTLSYFLADENTKEAVLIDPNFDDIQKLLYLEDEMDIKIRYIVDTHTHADHISGAAELKNLTGAKVIMHEKTKDKWQVVDEGDKFGIGDILRANAKIEIDRYVNDDDTLKVGSLKLKFLHTPGHTDNHISVLCEDKLFTGDLLLIGQAGRSDLPGGSPSEQFDSLFNKIINLPDDVKIYPGHDYENNEYSLLKDEKKNNPFLEKRSKDEYILFVKEFFSPVADLEDGGKITLQCGTKRVSTSSEKFQNISPAELKELIEKNHDLYLLDVREPFELMAFGAIPGVNNLPTSQIYNRINELPEDRTYPMVVICQSGNRSSEVAHYLYAQDYTNVYNLQGGTSGWVMNGFEVERLQGVFK
jgi:glyoxylase-like metal-dependent hydrolase (beta-lactamase superfamily II)/rhodanese-related sulfurtransferase